ncbi:MAG: SAM-dependent methyltransferase, partial [Sphingomonas sp.]
ILAELALRIARQGGALLAIDYGHEGPAIGDTLQALRGHAPADPLAAPGEADLTAHVDFTPLAAAARAAGLAVPPVATQGRFLSALGIAQRAAMLARAAPARAEDLAEAHRRLADPASMGRLFKVLGAVAPGWPAPAGFAG